MLEPSLDEVREENLQCYLKCAEAIEAHWRRGEEQEVAWYVLSDSVNVRKRIEALHGAKVVTRTDLVLEHTASGVDPDVIQGPSVSDEGFTAAAFEFWLWPRPTSRSSRTTAASAGRRRSGHCLLRCSTPAPSTSLPSAVARWTPPCPFCRLHPVWYLRAVPGVPR